MEVIRNTAAEAKRPKVSVCVVTYNQAAYIGKCLDSLLQQETAFHFEVLVADDHSADGTPDIVRVFADTYGPRVVPIFHDRNLGPFDNYRSVHRLARGDYVAHLDGDDIALPGKIAAQAQYLDDNPQCSAVFHQLVMIDKQGNPTGRYWPAVAPPQFNCPYLVRHHPVVGHSSLMYRNGLLREFLRSSGAFVDFRVYVELALRGTLGYIREPLGAYRLGVGIATSNDWLQLVLEAIDHAERNGVDAASIEYGRANQKYRAALGALNAQDEGKFVRYVEESMVHGRMSASQAACFALRHHTRLLLSILAVYRLLRRLGLAKDASMTFR